MVQTFQINMQLKLQLNVTLTKINRHGWTVMYDTQASFYESANLFLYKNEWKPMAVLKCKKSKSINIKLFSMHSKIVRRNNN